MRVCFPPPFKIKETEKKKKKWVWVLPKIPPIQIYFFKWGGGGGVQPFQHTTASSMDSCILSLGAIHQYVQSAMEQWHTVPPVIKLGLVHRSTSTARQTGQKPCQVRETVFLSKLLPEATVICKQLQAWKVKNRSSKCFELAKCKLAAANTDLQLQTLILQQQLLVNMNAAAKALSVYVCICQPEWCSNSFTFTAINMNTAATALRLHEHCSNSLMSAAVNMNTAATAVCLQLSTWTLQQQLYVCSCQHEHCSNSCMSAAVNMNTAATAVCLQLSTWTLQQQLYVCSCQHEHCSNSCMSAAVYMNTAATAVCLQLSTWTLQQQLYVCSCLHEHCSNSCMSAAADMNTAATAVCLQLSTWMLQQQPYVWSYKNGEAVFAATKSTLDKQNCLLFLPKSKVSPLTDANSVTAEIHPIFAASKVVAMSCLSESANLCLQQQTGFLQWQNYAPQLWVGLPRIAPGPKQLQHLAWAKNQQLFFPNSSFCSNSFMSTTATMHAACCSFKSWNSLLLTCGNCMWMTGL